MIQVCYFMQLKMTRPHSHILPRVSISCCCNLYNMSFNSQSCLLSISIGKYYLVDAGYPNRDGYLAPYKGERYHVPDFQRGAPPTTPVEKFNRIHSSKRNTIERTFGVWKMKWQILLKMPNYSIQTQKMIIAATMTLHNYVHLHDKEDIHFLRCQRDPDYVPTIPERYKKYVIPPNASDSSTPAESGPNMDLFRHELATANALSW